MLTIQEFNSDFAKSVKKHFDNQTMEAIRNSAMNKIFDVADTDEYSESFTSNEGVDQPTYFDENENLPESKIGKGYRSTFDSEEFGHTISVSKKARLKARDNTEKILEIVNNQKNGALVAMHSFLEKETHKILNDAFTGSYVLAPDGLSVCNDAHLWNSSDGTFDNKLASSALSLDVVKAVEAYGGAFVDSTGAEMPLNFKTIIVKKGGAAAALAKQIFGIENIRTQYQATSVGNINIYAGEYTIIETPWLTSGTAYFFVADSDMLAVENPMFVNFIERPQLQGDVMTESQNLSWKWAYAGSFKYGLRNLPFTLVGSPGS